MKKNHINFAHPNKWSDSLESPVESPSVATEIATGRRTKIIICKKRVSSRHHSYYRKLWKTIKKARFAKNQNLGPGVGYAWGRY